LCPYRARIGKVRKCGPKAPIIGEAADARRGIPYRGEHCQAAQRAASDIEGHSEAAELASRDD
jgi:hypothetical protein